MGFDSYLGIIGWYAGNDYAESNMVAIRIFHVVLMDIDMPYVEGIDGLQLIKNNFLR